MMKVIGMVLAAAMGARIDGGRETFPLTAPHEYQARYIKAALSGARFPCFIGGLQAGKTIAGADAVRELLYGREPLMLPPQVMGRMHAEVWVMSRSYALVDSSIATLRARTPERMWLGDAESRRLGLKRHDARSWWLAPRGGTPDPKPLLLRGRTASDPEAMRSTPSLLLAWCDEVAHWPPLTWLNLQGRGIVTRTRYLVTTTPAGKNWLYHDLVSREGMDPEVRVVTCRSADNPYADPKYLEALRRKFGPDYAAQELDALFTQDVRYVYDFDRTRHLARPPSDDPSYYEHRVAGVDPGYGDPYAACAWLRDWDGRWWMADEMYLPRKAIVADALPKLLEWSAKWRLQALYVDRRRPSDWEALRRAGLPAQANLEIVAEDGRRTIMPMIRVVQRLFREDRLRVAPHCEWFCEEAENYAFPEREGLNAGENPVDYRNHLMDAARYAIASVEATAAAGPRQYRVSERTLEYVPLGGGRRKRPGEPLRMPTLEESMAHQDRAFERLESERAR